MRIYGLTGGIASGKSTVATMFAALGAPIVDADQLAREVVAPGSPGLARLVERFGPDILDDEGRLDRKRLGALIFADPGARAELNRITHPLIAQAGQEALQELAKEGHAIALYEAALIVENGLHKGLDGLIVVHVPEELQLQRLQNRDGFDLDEARARLAAQLPPAEKLAVADFVIDNSKSQDETRAQVKALWSQLRSAQDQNQQ